MFANCLNLLNLDVSKFNTSNVTDMGSMFSKCEKLESIDLSNWNTSKVTDMSTMFSNCKNLLSLDLSNWNTSNVTNMSYMFQSCKGLTSIDLSSFDTSKVANFRAVFTNCENLKTITGKLDLYKGDDYTYMFQYCYQLETVTLKNIKKALTMGSGASYGTKLTNETLINTIQQLWDLTGSSSQTLTLSTTSKTNIANIYVKLITPTQEQIDADPYINNKKPCEVCESTDEGAMTLTEYATSKNWAIA
jgi:surface protein